VFLSRQRRRRPWRPPGRYGTSTCRVAAFRGFAWSHRYAPSGDVPSAVLPRWHGHRIRRRICFILFFRRLESKLVFIFFLYQFIDSIESLQQTPLPTPHPRWVCARSGLTVISAPLEAAEAHHGGLWLCCRNEKKRTIPTWKNLLRDSFCSRPNANRG
jgi:hypothetical protein